MKSYLLCSLLLLPLSVQASEYGCKVQLCLSNPGGPREFSECHPSIDKLYDDLKKGRGFPRCEEADNNDAKPVFDHDKIIRQWAQNPRDIDKKEDKK